MIVQLKDLTHQPHQLNAMCKSMKKTAKLQIPYIIIILKNPQ